MKNIFPELKINNLKQSANEWVNDYQKNNIDITAIILYKYRPSLDSRIVLGEKFRNNNGAAITFIKYVIVFEFMHYESKYQSFEKIDIEEPYYNFIARDTHYLSTGKCEIPTAIKYSFVDVYEDFTKKNFDKEWTFLPRCKNINFILPEQIRVDEGSVVLYDTVKKSDDSNPKKQSTKNTLSLQKQLDYELTKICPELEKFYAALLEEIENGDYGVENSINKIGVSKLRTIALDYFDRARNEYKVLNKKLILETGLYQFSGNRRRMFIRNVLQEYLKDHPAINNQKIKTSKEALQNRYNKINRLT